MVRVAVIGAGHMGERHVATYAALPGVEVWVTDTDRDRAAGVASRYDVRHEPEPERLLRAGADGIDVCVPTSHHYRTVLKAMDTTRHIICEKPLVDQISQANRLREAAADKGVFVTVGYLYRHHPGIQYARRQSTSGELGECIHGLFRLGGRGGRSEWKHRRATGGGAVLEMLVHLLDLAHWIFGDIEAACPVAHQTLRPRRSVRGVETEVNAEDWVITLVRTVTGVRLTLYADLLSPGFSHSIEIQGTKGSVQTSIVPSLPTIGHSQVGQPDVQYYGYVDLLHAELTAFIEEIRAGHPSGGMHRIDDTIALWPVLQAVLEGRAYGEW